MPTATVAKSQQVVAPIDNTTGVASGSQGIAAPKAGLIEPVLQPQTQANAQGLAPSQLGLEQPMNPAALKKGGS